MNDSEIIKALECCSECNCKSCPQCQDIDLGEILGLINCANDKIDSQKAEIERLSCRVSDLAEIEKDYALKHGNNHDVEIVKKNIRENAIKEFAEKLKEYCNEIANQEWNKRTLPVSWADAYKDFIDDIDRLLEEMGCNDG